MPQTSVFGLSRPTRPSTLTSKPTRLFSDINPVSLGPSRFIVKDPAAQKAQTLKRQHISSPIYIFFTNCNSSLIYFSKLQQQIEWKLANTRTIKIQLFSRTLASM